MTYKPLRVEFLIDGMMVVPDFEPVLLDSLLLARATHGQPILATMNDEVALPVAKATTTAWPQPIWLASQLTVQWAGPSVGRLLHRNVRPLDLLSDSAQHKATTVDSSTGLPKTARTQLAIRHAVKATAWCIGVQEEVCSLLAGVYALGAHRHLGYGRVRQVDVIEDSLATTLAWSRPIPGFHPDDPIPDRERRPGRSTPPYWVRDMKQDAWWPRRDTTTRSE